MVIISSIIMAWFIAVGGLNTLFFIFSFASIFTLLYVFYKITT